MVANLVENEARFREVKNEIAEQCAQDSKFRQKLLDNPHSTIEEKYELPADSLKEIDFKVVVEEPGSVVIPIPPNLSEMELTDEQLDQVAAGAAFGAFALPMIPVVCMGIDKGYTTRERGGW